MTASIRKASGILETWQTLYDKELTANASNFTIDNIKGNAFQLLKIIVSGSTAAFAGAPSMVLNDDITTAHYASVRMLISGSTSPVATDTTTYENYPFDIYGNFWLQDYPFITEITLNPNNVISAEHLIRMETSVIKGVSPSLIISAGSYTQSDEITKIVLTGDSTYGDYAIGGNAGTFRFKAGTRVQIHGLAR